ncbi:MAG: HIRAN domain-containing protein [Methanobrevibacter sp.]|nr:HIRAN domain-containing protein [Methanobrevibacter sp.]
MGNLEKVNSTDIVRAIHNSDLTDPLFEKIFLIESTIAGTHYVENIKKIEPNLKVGDRLDFYREPNNSHDEKAILVKHRGDKIGYVPRVDNEILANLMDAGKLLYGELSYKNYEGDWLRIDFDIYLED